MLTTINSWLDSQMTYVVSGAIGERKLGHFWEEFNPIVGLALMLWFLRTVYRAWFRC